jgi:hypothetical protein
MTVRRRSKGELAVGCAWGSQRGSGGHRGCSECGRDAMGGARRGGKRRKGGAGGPTDGDGKKRERSTDGAAPVINVARRSFARPRETGVAARGDECDVL